MHNKVLGLIQDCRTELILGTVRYRLCSSRFLYQTVDFPIVVVLCWLNKYINAISVLFRKFVCPHVKSLSAEKSTAVRRKTPAVPSGSQLRISTSQMLHFPTAKAHVPHPNTWK